LGNPGKDYEETRHNLGFLAVGRLAERHDMRFRSGSWIKGLIAEGRIAGKTLYCLLPLTYMNNSGIAVKQFMIKKGLGSGDLLIVCDDLNLDFGQMRIRPGGTGGGHNGLSSIIEKIETQSFARLRMGIGAPLKGEDAARYVLEGFPREEKKSIDGFIDQAADCCLMWLEEGINKAMDKFNKRNDHGKNDHRSEI
jgi:PTH1 family peptidyl-tRNA hydrolase